ncbi:unnamed protein product [Coregonus sp. 'balchen']|nr:unnamed protein product [Coregonus sp. 'balchen']
MPPLPSPGSDESPIPPTDLHMYPMPDYPMPTNNQNMNARNGPMLPSDYPNPGFSMPPNPHMNMPPNPHMNMTGNWRTGELLVGEAGSEPDMLDMSYCQTLLEVPVPPPMDQVPWFCICSRCKASVGPKGDSGDRGLPGIPGSPGRRGLTGFRGRPGFVGRQGLKGQKGDQNEKGELGPMGFTGTKGARGFKGDKGDQGLEGPQGEMGPQGEVGTCPASCESVQGHAGQPGIPGPAGARGLPGVAGPPGTTGPKGDTGDMGAPGVPGTDGEKGELGAEGVCNCTDGADGADGQQGIPGPKGEQGEVGPQGAVGLNGEKGNQGELGMMGIPGPCSPTIQSSFSAALGTIYPLPDKPVPFTQVITNQQFHFDPTIGIYRAPVNGTYVFSYHLVVFSKVLKVGLFHNFNPIVKTTEPAHLGTASQQVVLHLAMGDRVWLQVKDTITNGMYADNESRSTFSGFLLHPDSCDLPLFRDFPPAAAPSGDEGTYSWGQIEGPTTTPSP